MAVSKIREKSTSELEAKLKSLKEELFNLRFQNAINQLDNPMRIKAVRKDIARINTILREQELGIEVNKEMVLASDKLAEKDEAKKKAEEKKAKKKKADEDKAKNEKKAKEEEKPESEEPVAEAESEQATETEE